MCCLTFFLKFYSLSLSSIKVKDLKGDSAPTTDEKDVSKEKPEKGKDKKDKEEDKGKEFSPDTFRSEIKIGITGSFGNVDPANKDSIAGIVYFQILSNISKTPIKLIYNNLNISRKEMKQKTVDIVLAILSVMIEKM